jgi:hypothetical protein
LKNITDVENLVNGERQNHFRADTFSQHDFEGFLHPSFLAGFITNLANRTNAFWPAAEQQRLINLEASYRAARGTNAITTALHGLMDKAVLKCWNGLRVSDINQCPPSVLCWNRTRQATLSTCPDYTCPSENSTRVKDPNTCPPRTTIPYPWLGCKYECLTTTWSPWTPAPCSPPTQQTRGRDLIVTNTTNCTVPQMTESRPCQA